MAIGTVAVYTVAASLLFFSLLPVEESVRAFERHGNTLVGIPECVSEAAS